MVSAGAQADLLAFVNAVIGDGVWGTEGRTKLARIYYLAHLATVALNSSGARGPIISESEGGVSASYATPQQITNSELAGSRYGLLYLELRRHLGARVGMVL